MKKNGVLNQEIIRIIAAMGHTDQLVICDAGLPVPTNIECVDVSVSAGIPDFISTVRAVNEELCIESWLVAEETHIVNPHIYSDLLKILGDYPVKTISHQELKELSHHAIAIIRTGECTPYSNVILVGGTSF